MWIYEGNPLENINDFPEGAYGFVYRVTHKESGISYIGKKNLYSNRTLPPLKGAKRKRKITKESDWKNYYGSHPHIKKLVKEGTSNDFTREVLKIVFTKKALTYYELKYQCIFEVLENENTYLNDNILGKFFRRDLQHG